MDYSSFFLIIYNLSLHREKPGFHQQPSNYLISVPVYMCTGFRIVNLYPHRKSLYQLDCNACVPFAFSLAYSTYFQRPNLIPPLPYVRWFFAFILHLDSCHIPHSIGRSPDLLNNFLKFACIEVYSFCFKVL